jgi:autotransporter-associated beta strand protein
LTVDVPTDTTFTMSGDISGTDGLIVNDNPDLAGTLVLTGNNTFSGGTTIEGGALAVGSATALGAGSTTNDAGLETTASLGGNVEKINVATTYTQGDAATLLLQVVTSPNTIPALGTGVAGVNYDTLASVGVATLAGALDLNFGVASVPAQGQRYVALSAGSPLTTEFLSTTTNLLAPFTTVTTYNDTFNGTEPVDSAIVTLIKPFASFQPLTPNQTSVAKYVDSTLSYLNNNGYLGMPTGADADFFNNIVTGLNATTFSAGALGPALDELSPQRFEILHNIAFDNYAFDVQSLDDELARERTGPGGIDTSGFTFNDSQLGPELSQVKGRLLAWSPSAQPGLLSDSTRALLAGPTART